MTLSVLTNPPCPQLLEEKLCQFSLVPRGPFTIYNADGKWILLTFPSTMFIYHSVDWLTETRCTSRDQRVCVHLGDSNARTRKGTGEELPVDMGPPMISVVPSKGKETGVKRIRTSKEIHCHQRRWDENRAIEALKIELGETNGEAVDQRLW